MLFKVDENLHDEVAEAFKARGHDAMTVFDQSLQGKIDEIIGEVCRAERRALVTMDLDFASEVDFPPQDYPGLIVLRLGVQSRHRTLVALEQVFTLLEKESPSGSLWIVEDHRVRVRRPSDANP